MKQFLEILGIDYGLSKEEIKKAYRKKSMQVHPDRANGDEYKMMLLNTAYEYIIENYESYLNKQEIIEDNPLALFNEGLYIYYVLKDYELAIHRFDKIILLNHKYVNAYFMKGLCFEKLGKEKDALKVYDELLSIDPEYYKAYLNRGNIYKNLGNKQKAQKDFDSSLEFMGGIKNNLKLAKKYFELQDYYNAIHFANKVFYSDSTTHPRYKEGYFLLKQIYNDLGDNEKIIEITFLFIEKTQYYKEYIYLSKMLLEKGDFIKTLEASRKFIEKGIGSVKDKLDMLKNILICQQTLGKDGETKETQVKINNIYGEVLNLSLDYLEHTDKSIIDEAYEYGIKIGNTGNIQIFKDNEKKNKRNLDNIDSLVNEYKNVSTDDLDVPTFLRNMM